MPNTKILTYCGVVYPWQCDHMGHMNVMWYTGKFDEASWSFAAKLGIDTSYVREHHFGLAGVQQNIAYKKELIAGDVVNVYTGILELRPKVLVLRHEMINISTGDTAATSDLTIVHVDLRSRKSHPFPQIISDRVRDFMERPPD